MAIIALSVGFVLYLKRDIIGDKDMMLCQCRSNVIQIRSALATYKETYGTFPNTLFAIPQKMLYKYCLACPMSHECDPLKDKKTDYVYSPNNPKQVITKKGEELYTILYCKSHYEKGYIIGLFADSPEGAQSGFMPTGIKQGVIHSTSRSRAELELKLNAYGK